MPRQNSVARKIVETVLESLKSDKQRLYEKHILDGEGKLKLYNPIVQSIFLKVLEGNGLEEAVRAHDEALRDEKDAS